MMYCRMVLIIAWFNDCVLGMSDQICESSKCDGQPHTVL